MVGSQRDKESSSTPSQSRKRNRKNRKGGKGNRRRNKKCKKQKYRDYYIEEHGCRSKRPYKMAKCVASEGSAPDACVPTKIKTRKIKFVCPDGSTPRREVEMVRKCGKRKKESFWKK